MTPILALAALAVLFAIFQVPAQTSAWLHVARQRWQQHLGEKATRWTWAKYYAVRLGIRAIGLGSMAIGLHYVFLVSRDAGWLAMLAEAAR